MENKRIGLKVTGIILGIIAVVVLLAVLFGSFVMPVWKYNVAVDNAAKGEYALATRGLYNLDYKDSEALGQKYALEAGKQYIEAADTQMAMTYLDVAINTGDNEDIRNEAKKLFDELKNNQ